MTDNIKRLITLLKASDDIVFLGGAGVSTGSGIPDFRSENGIYKTIQKYGGPPEKILSRSYFDRHTHDFYDFYRNEMVHTEVEPNDAHKALARLESMGKLSAVITQNIDGLHQRGGSGKVLELHGSIHRNYCMNCHQCYQLDYVMAYEAIPLCERCAGIVKPDVVLYEEGLDDDVLNQSVEAVKRADMMIVGGTSLNVYPAAGLIRYFGGDNLVLINKGVTPYDSEADLVIREDIGAVLKVAVEALL